jgi:adenylate cyclase
VKPQRVERKLAAILAADMAGYSRLTGIDEEGTLARLRAVRADLISPAIAEHRGRIVKTMGDGLLIEFASVVDAVRCAIAIQRRLASRNGNLLPDQRIEFRVGIHLGDVVIERDDLLGDGVNVAARLEGLAEPGGICISEDAYRQVRDKLPFTFADTGEQTVKNIARPLRVYALDAEAVRSLPDAPAAAGALRSSPGRHGGFRRATLAAAVAAAAILLAGGLWFALEPTRGPQPSANASRFSIVVLPFANLGGDPTQDYLADVLTEELTTSLSRIRNSFVIARSTAFTYKGKSVDVKRIGRDLGVRYALEGSEQQSGKQVRVSAQLIDAETGAHLWADQFDADRADLLEMQDEIVTRLSQALQQRLVEIDVARIARIHPGDLDAEDLAMRCNAALASARPGSAEVEAAYGLCDRALQLDGRNVRALVTLGFKYINRVLELQSSDRAADIRRGDELVSRALAVDPNAYGARFANAQLLLTQRRFAESIVEAQRSLALNPSFVNAYFGLSYAYSLLGEPEKALDYADKAIRLSPRDPLLHVFYQQKAFALSLLRRDDQAIEWLRRAVAVAPEWPVPQALLAAALALNGDEAAAREMLERYLSLAGTRARTIAQWKAQQPSDNPVVSAYTARVMAGLRKAGMPEE